MKKYSSIVEAVAWHSENEPEKLCIIDEIEYTYASFYELILAIRKKMIDEGMKQGECILVECSQDAKFLAIAMACQLLGVIFVPLERNIKITNLIDYIQKTTPNLIVLEKNCEVNVKTILYSDLPISQPMKDDYAFPEKENVAEILFTTGTTGTSKGIVISNKANVALAENIVYGTQMKHDNIELIPLPISHSHGLRCCYANLLNGSTIVLTDGVLMIKRVFNLIEKYEISAIDLSPSATDVLLKLSKDRFMNYREKIDYIQIGTAFLQEETKNRLMALLPNARLYNFYGSTEAGRCCVLDFNRYKGKKCCIGKPTINAQIIIVDDNMEAIKSSSDKMGVLAIAGEMNMNEYFKAPELTSKTLKHGYVITSDIGYIDESGFIYVLGRKNDVINYKGIKIAPDEIEQIIKKYEEVEDCACVPVDDPISGQVPILFIQITNPENFDMLRLKEYINSNIDENKKPQKVLIVNKVPRTSNGKIQRMKLKEMYDE